MPNAAIAPRASGDRCPTYRCGARLRFEVRAGRVVESCDACTLRRAGICPDCRRPMPHARNGLRLRCVKCARRRLRMLEARRERPAAQVVATRRRMREQYRANPEPFRARKREEHRFLRAIIGYTNGRCTTCDATVPYQGKGPIPRYCAAHRPYRNAPGRCRRAGEPNPLVPCACGCDTPMERFNRHGRPRRYLPGHNCAAEFRLERGAA